MSIPNPAFDRPRPQTLDGGTTRRCNCERCRHGANTGRWRRSGQRILLDLGHTPGSPVDELSAGALQPSAALSSPHRWAFLLGQGDSSGLESELFLPGSVKVELAWSGPLLGSVAGATINGPTVPIDSGVYVIYNPPPKPAEKATPRYLGYEQNMRNRFAARYKVFREFGVENFQFAIYAATATLSRDGWTGAIRTKKRSTIKDAEAMIVLAESALLHWLCKQGRFPRGNVVMGEKLTPTGSPLSTLTVVSDDNRPPGLDENIVIPISEMGTDAAGCGRRKAR